MFFIKKMCPSISYYFKHNLNVLKANHSRLFRYIYGFKKQLYDKLFSHHIGPASAVSKYDIVRGLTVTSTDTLRLRSVNAHRPIVLQQMTIKHSLRDGIFMFPITSHQSSNKSIFISTYQLRYAISSGMHNHITRSKYSMH